MSSYPVAKLHSSTAIADDTAIFSGSKQDNSVATLILYGGAALAEIAGCFAFWAWLRLGKSAIWLIPGMLALAMFAYLLLGFVSLTENLAMVGMALWMLIK